MNGLEDYIQVGVGKLTVETEKLGTNRPFNRNSHRVKNSGTTIALEHKHLVSI
jgi:hypothetical protein